MTKKTVRDPETLRIANERPMWAIDVDDLGSDPDAPMTERQAAYLRELTERLDEPFDAALTKQQAKNRIRALEDRL